ncbi:MAG: transposase [Burkholderiaceae bacterium]|nr:transposase [Burkholderiaceae bacterium]MDH3461154.1 transposase [Burkholderiaceae bacterium]
MSAKTPRRRRYDAVLKSSVLSECAKPGASVAAVASAYGLDADTVHKWRYQARKRLSSASRADRSAGAHGGKFVGLSVPSAPAGAAADMNICIEVRRGNDVVVVSWPIAAAIQCAALLAQCMR